MQCRKEEIITRSNRTTGIVLFLIPRSQRSVSTDGHFVVRGTSLLISTSPQSEPQGPLPEESNSSSDQDRALHRAPAMANTTIRHFFGKGIVPDSLPKTVFTHSCAESKPPQASTTIWRPERVCEDHTIDTPQKMLSRSGSTEQFFSSFHKLTSFIFRNRNERVLCQLHTNPTLSHLA